ncbi:MAG: aldose 1-epimerase family protein [Clostridia bacterium]|nr:aldose 1-epimerase family protein [Clostridia bacterium]
MVYTIENSNLSVSVETKGAQLKSVFSKHTGVEYLWQGDARYWTGRAYNLFPFVGRFAEGKYVVEGKEYAMDRHGFARGSEFALTEQTDNSLTFEIRETDQTLAIYPFRFIFTVKFKIEGKRLTVRYGVKNMGENTMYFGLGGHPGFNVPFDGGRFEDYFVEFEEVGSPTQVIANEKGLMTTERRAMELENGKIIRLEHGLFDNDAIIMQGACKTVYIKSDKTKRSIKVSYPNMDYLGLWHMPKTDAPYLCVEPWMTLPSPDGKPEVLETKENIGVLEPNQDFSIDFDIEIIE